MAKPTIQKFLVYPIHIAQFISLVKIFKNRVEISNQDIRYNPDADKFVCDIYCYEELDAVLFQNLAVTFVQCKYVDSGITEE